MKLEILDINKFIKENDVKEVTSTNFFIGNIAAEGGLFDPEIFGYFAEEEKNLYGYIDLKGQYIHPLVVINLMRMGSLGSILLQHDNIKKKWAKVVDGKIVYVKKDDPDAESGKEFYWNNFDKIEWNKTLSGVRETDDETDINDEPALSDIEAIERELDRQMEDFSVSKQGRINFIKSLTKETFFIDKWLVIPKGFRNISSESRTLGSDINKEYRKLLTNINAMSRFSSSSIFGITRIQEYLIQSVILINLFKDSISWVTGKSVDFNRSSNRPAPTVGVAKNSNFFEKVIGKSVDYSSRNVIIAPTIATKNSWKDVDALAGYAGIPLSTIASSFLPFMIKHAVDIIAELEMNIERQMLKWDENFVRIEPSSKLFIEKLIKSFIKSDNGRFNKYDFVMIYEDDNGKQYKQNQSLMMNIATDRSQYANRTYRRRYFTVTDLMYQAALKAIEGRYCLLVRYPVLNHLNIFPSGINLMSTKKEDKGMYILYNFNVNWADSDVPSDALLYFDKYPKIPLLKGDSLDQFERITEDNSFINALIPGNTALKSIGGDYDGDTLSVVGLFTEEANEEAKKYINSPGYYIGSTNKNIRSLGEIGKEYVMGLYMLTKD